MWRIHVQRRHLADKGADGEEHPVHELELLQTQTVTSHSTLLLFVLFGDMILSPPPSRCQPVSSGSTRCSKDSFHFGQICISYEPSSETHNENNSAIVSTHSKQDQLLDVSGAKSNQ